jgi:hypothetical protein
MSEPKYWMNETTGVLRPAIMALVDGSTLTQAQLATLRGYFHAWLDSPVWDQNPTADESDKVWLAARRAEIDGLTDREKVESWVDALIASGMDPL